MNKKIRLKFMLALSVLMAVTSLFVSVPAVIKGSEVIRQGNKDYIIINPYETVKWESFGQYKAALHTHTKESDGKNSPAEVIEHHYKLGYDVLALTDHNFTSTTYHRTDRPSDKVYLTKERAEEINKGVGRNGRGMIGVPYSNEQSRSDHVNTFWADFNNTSGVTLEDNLKKCEELGGISHLNHPGRYTGGSRQYGDQGVAASSKPETIAKYVSLFKRFNSCVGMEIVNKKDSGSASDRILWDNILKETMPKLPVWGFSNDDSHKNKNVDYSYNIMLMPENNLKNIRYSMENGTFYAVARVAKRELGKSFEGEGKTPKITNISVDENLNSITISGENYEEIEWIADGEIIAKGNSINLNNFEDKINNYIRAQLKGPGGIAFTQPFGIRVQ
jgi:hypothetical protein